MNTTTHTVWGQRSPASAPVVLFTGTLAACRYELFRLGRGSWPLLTIN